MIGIGSVSRGQLAAITIVKGHDAGWLAAISEWLFDLRVTIRSSEGAELYSNSKQMEPQIIVIFEQPGDSSPSQQLRTVGKTYVLVDATQILAFRLLGDNLTATSGRVPWTALLASVFREDFRSLLLDSTQIPRTAIGSAARMLRGIVLAEENIDKGITSSWTTHVYGSYGKSYIQNNLGWFPELAPSAVAMHKASSLSFLEAKTKLRKSNSETEAKLQLQYMQP